jgi:branched-chain amino acid transport system permease protein
MSRTDLQASSDVTFDFGKAIKDAAIAALIALGVFGIILGFQTTRPDMVVNSPGADSGILDFLFGRYSITNTLVARPGLLLTVLVCVFIGSLIRSWQLVQREIKARMPAIAGAKPKVSRWAGIEAKALPVIFVLMAAFPIISMLAVGPQGSLKWIGNYGVQILIYIMLGWGLNIVVGLAGLLDLGYVAFYAIGAYTYALLQTYYGLSFWWCLPAAGAMAALWGIMLGFPVLRLRGDYLAIVTLAFGEIIYLVAKNWKDFTGGGTGLSVQRIDFFGIPFNASSNGFSALFGLPPTPVYRLIFLYYIIFALALLTAVVTIRLKKLPIGRAWEALREDEIACRSLGINTTNTKLTAFAIGATFGGLAGCCFGANVGLVTPESFLFIESAFILAIVVLGGMGSLLGVVLATIALVGGIEGLRELDVLKAWFGDDFDPTKYRYLIVGVGMVLMMLWKPRGLISTRTPTVFLKERKVVSGDLVKEGHG